MVFFAIAQQKPFCVSLVFIVIIVFVDNIMIIIGTVGAVLGV